QPGPPRCGEAGRTCRPGDGRDQARSGPPRRRGPWRGTRFGAAGAPAYARTVNWLAHLQLARDQTFERLGPLSGDFVRGLGIPDVDPDLRPGLRAHRAIDAFTDAHPMVRRSRARLVPAGRFSGVLVDLLYDHVLARGWQHHAPDQPPLRAFVDQVHVE